MIHAMRAAAAVLLLVACQTPAPVATHVEVAAPKPSASASSSAEPTVLHQPSSSLAVVARFAPEVTVAVFPLGRDALVSQASATAWSVTALDRDDRQTPMLTRPGAHFEIFQAGGSSAKNAWITTMDENGFPAIRFETWHIADKTTNQAARFLAVGELRPGQWVALPSHLLPAYLYDEVPSKFENVAGTGDVPKVPTAIRLVRVAFLGNGRVCGVGVTKKPYGGFDMVAWNGGDDGVSIGFDDAAQAASVVRGRDGECLVLRPRDKTTDVGRFRGSSSIAWSTLGRSVAQAATAPSGTLWFWDGDRRELARTTNADDATLTSYAMPRDVPECPHMDDVTSIAATSDDDALVAVRGACANETFALVRTSPRVAIQNWPAP
jgi:hypothetical protein